VGAGASALGSTIGSIASAYSDERLKKDIRSAEKDTYSFLDALNASKYRYKEKDIDGEEERVSVMAQELEKSKLGKGFVLETPRGKMVDYGKGLGTLLAAQSSLHKRLKQLEGA
jgi:cob(I)alamin adenosyltransferase